MAEKLLITSPTVSLRKAHSPIWLQRMPKDMQNYMLIYGYIAFYAGNTCVRVRELYHFRRVSNKLFLPSFQSKWLKFVLLRDE